MPTHKVKSAADGSPSAADFLRVRKRARVENTGVCGRTGNTGSRGERVSGREVRGAAPRALRQEGAKRASSSSVYHSTVGVHSSRATEDKPKCPFAARVARGAAPPRAPARSLHPLNPLSLRPAPFESARGGLDFLSLRLFRCSRLDLSAVSPLFCQWRSFRDATPAPD